MSKTQSWRRTRAYRIWSALVKRRDKVCKCCGDRKNGHAHHIKKAQNYPELRFDVDNGIRLCNFCHYFLHNQIARGYRYMCGEEHVQALLTMKHVIIALKSMKNDARNIIYGE